MEEQFDPTDQKDIRTNPLFRVTTLSKYLALALFVALPFLGAWVGYEFAPEKAVEMEKIVEKEKIKEVVQVKNIPASLVKVTTQSDGVSRDVAQPPYIELDKEGNHVGTVFTSQSCLGHKMFALQFEASGLEDFMIKVVEKNDPANMYSDYVDLSSHGTTTVVKTTLEISPELIYGSYDYTDLLLSDQEPREYLVTVYDRITEDIYIEQDMFFFVSPAILEC